MAQLWSVFTQNLSVMNKEKYVLITGATSGIGYELARLFAKDQYNLVIVARNEDDLKRTAHELTQEFGINVISVPKDLFRREAPFELYDELSSRRITVEILVNNAAQGQFGEFIHNDINRELDLIQLNIGAYVVLTKLFLQDMVLRESGKILNVASVAGKVPGPYQAVYHATKAFTHSFNEAVRSEIKDTGVVLTSLLPGPTDTGFFEKADMQNSKVVQEGDMADPADVARDGYDALMAGKDMVISGFKNKVQVAVSNVTPDSMVADNMKETQKPVDKE